MQLVFIVIIIIGLSKSNDLAPSDYHLFRSLCNNLKYKKCENEDELKKYLQDFFDFKSEEFYASGICDLHRRWEKVIDTNGEYIYLINTF